MLKNRQIILGVSGGIAAYKSVELLRLIQDAGGHTRVVMTANAEQFVGPVTFQALSGRPVLRHLFEAGASDAAIHHIEWAQESDAVVLAPATANVIGKLASGIADDALTTMMMAVTAPILVCPAMNTNMYQSPAVVRNVDRLRQDGYHILAPESGELACGTVGPGRLPAPSDILDALTAILLPDDFSGKRLLVTAGPTRETIDPVRFISNPSSGKMGFAVAKAASQRGAAVTLITGPSALPDPAGITVVRIESAHEMTTAVLDRFDATDIVVKTAAVSDYRPEKKAKSKIKKVQDEMTLRLVKNQDILKTLGSRKSGQILIGFAAETDDLRQNAQSKIKNKNLDMIVGNLIGTEDAGFASDNNTVNLFFPDGTVESLPTMTKLDVAHSLLDRVLKIMGESNDYQTTDRDG